MSTRRNIEGAVTRARNLRREQTTAEASLWQYLRSHRLANLHFRRQHPIGKYIVDFCAPNAKIIIELDGSPHLEQHEYDAERSAYLTAHGYRVLRFWNSAVLDDVDGVIQKITAAIKSTPTQSPPF